MRVRSAVVLVGVLLPICVVGAIGLRRTLSSGNRELVVDDSSFPSDSCALAEPLRMDFLFNCDVVGDQFALCSDLDKSARDRERKGLDLQVRAIQVSWVSALRSIRLVERLQSGEIEFDSKLAQRVFDEMFRVFKVGSPPRAPTTKRGFIEVLKCAPYTWASIVVSANRSLTDLDLRELRQKLPDAASVEPTLKDRLGFLGSPTEKTGD